MAGHDTRTELAGVMTMIVTDIQRFSIHDGPGVRTTVFLHGCPLRCGWCHNPETANNAPPFWYDKKKCLHCSMCADGCPAGAITPVSQHMPIDKIVEIVCRDKAFYREDGGVTLSGGEPLMRFSDALELLQALKVAGVHTCVETSGAFAATEEQLGAFAKVCDLVLFDVKDTDKSRLFRNTGAVLADVLTNLRMLDERAVPTRIRAVLLGMNTNDTHAGKLAAMYRTLHHCNGIDLLPYHPYGGGKAARLGLVYEEDASWHVTAQAVEAFAAKLEANDIPVHIQQRQHI